MLERMSSVLHHVKRMSLATAMFIALTIAGSVIIGQRCFPTYAHGPMKLECELSLYAPLISSIISGAFFGWRSDIRTAPLAIVAPALGLSVLLFQGDWLRYWYGEDIVAALRLAVFFCITPALLASIVGSVISSCRRANAL